MRSLWISWGVILILESTAMACPACAVSNAQRDPGQTFWILSAMGILPLIVALIAGVFIVRVVKNDKA